MLHPKLNLKALSAKLSKLFRLDVFLPSNLMEEIKPTLEALSAKYLKPFISKELLRR